MDSPTVLRRRLGAELRRLREPAGLQAKEAAEATGFSGTKISRIESGQATLKEVDVRSLLKLYGVTDAADLQKFILLTRQSTQRGWWHDYGDSLPEWFQTYVGMEGDASEICAHETELVPGLLQIPEYARGVFEVWPRRLSEHEIEHRVNLRLQRQEIFNSPNPPQFRAILNEAVLTRPAGGPEAMNRQIQHLISLSERPSITIQILPLSADPHPSMGLSFQILSFSDVPGDIVYLEGLTSALYIEKETDIALYRLAFEQLERSATTPEESSLWMRKVAAERYGYGG
ncbi:helix-turn-helix domain-containing protein [Kitasatospora sp. NPDC008050]|uniref:helix-turn-helix domain-containing protein n=1 Tax=Kitasatospora sp. NPDC008050 TaxID=3364021 RepID=UPI0036EF4F98